jgi:two-component system, NarL family, response regulator DevR
MPPESGTAPISVLLADNNEIVRKAIRRLLQSDPEIQLVAEAPSFLATMDLARKLRPRVVVMDLHMQDEDAVTVAQLRSNLASARVLAISLWTDNQTKTFADSVGALALLDKTKLGTELIASIKQYAKDSARPSKAFVAE